MAAAPNILPLLSFSLLFPPLLPPSFVQENVLKATTFGGLLIVSLYSRGVGNCVPFFPFFFPLLFLPFFLFLSRQASDFSNFQRSTAAWKSCALSLLLQVKIRKRGFIRATMRRARRFNRHFFLFSFSPPSLPSSGRWNEEDAVFPMIGRMMSFAGTPFFSFFPPLSFLLFSFLLSLLWARCRG